MCPLRFLRSLRRNQLGPEHYSRSGNCLVVLLLIVAVVVIVVLAFELAARDKADEEARKQPPPPQKTAEEQELERIENLVFLENPDIARDPKIDLSDKSVAVMEKQLALARRRLEAARRSRATAETKFKRDKDNQRNLEDKLDKLDAELEASPDDDDLAEEIGEYDLRLSESRSAIAQAEADLTLLRSYEKQMARLVQDMEAAIEKARRSGDAVVSTADMDALKTHYNDAMAAGTVVDDQRRNAQPAANSHVAEEEGRSSAARERARARLERRRAARAGEENP